jgi:hypothetical protein
VGGEGHSGARKYHVTKSVSWRLRESVRWRRSRSDGGLEKSG